MPLPKLLVAVFGIPEERAKLLMRRHGSHALRLLAMDRAWFEEEPRRLFSTDAERWEFSNLRMLEAAFLDRPGRVRKHAERAAALLDKARADKPGGDIRRVYSHWAQAHRHVARKPAELIEAMEDLRVEAGNTTVRAQRENRRQATEWLHETGRMEALLMLARQRGRERGGGGKKRRK